MLLAGSRERGEQDSRVLQEVMGVALEMLIPTLRLLEPLFHFIISLLTVSWHCTVLKVWLQHGLPSDHPFLHEGGIRMTPQT